jgi:hypothetical protein
VDQTTIVSYALTYLATTTAVFFMFLPAFIILTLLLLTGGAIQLVILLLKVTTVWLFKGASTLLKKSVEKLHRHGSGGGKLAPR